MSGANDLTDLGQRLAVKGLARPYPNKIAVQSGERLRKPPALRRTWQIEIGAIWLGDTPVSPVSLAPCAGVPCQGGRETAAPSAWSDTTGVQADPAIPAP